MGVEKSWKGRKKFRPWKVLNLGIGPKKVLILVSCTTVVVKQFLLVIYYIVVCHRWCSRKQLQCVPHARWALHFWHYIYLYCSAIWAIIWSQKGTKIRPDFWYLRSWKVLNFYLSDFLFLFDIWVGTTGKWHHSIPNVAEYAETDFAVIVICYFCGPLWLMGVQNIRLQLWPNDQAHILFSTKYVQ